MKHLEKKINTNFPNHFMFTVFENKNCQRRIFQNFFRHHKISEMETFAKKVIEEHTNYFNRYFKYLPKNLPTVLKTFYVADYLDRHEENKIHLDEEEKIIKYKLNNFYKILNDITVDEISIISLFTSKMYETIIENFEIKINNNSNEKLLMFAAHDISMSAFLLSLKEDAYSYNIEFNSEISFILKKMDSEFYVSIQFEHIDLELKFCDYKTICEFQKFKKFIQNIISNEEKLRKYCEGELDNLISDDLNFTELSLKDEI